MSISTVNLGSDALSQTTHINPAVNVPAGVTIIILMCDCGLNTNIANTITDDAGNIYTQAIWYNGLAIWYSSNVLALSTSDQISGTVDTGGTASITVMYATGLSNISPVETSGTNSVTSASPTVSTSGNVTSGNLVFSGVFENASSITLHQSVGWTNIPVGGGYFINPDGANGQGISGSLIAVSTAIQTYSPTFSSSKAFSCIIAAFKIAPPPDPTYNRNLRFEYLCE